MQKINFSFMLLCSETDAAITYTSNFECQRTFDLVKLWLQKLENQDGECYRGSSSCVENKGANVTLCF